MIKRCTSLLGNLFMKERRISSRMTKKFSWVSISFGVVEICFKQTNTHTHTHTQKQIQKKKKRKEKINKTKKKKPASLPKNCFSLVRLVWTLFLCCCCSTLIGRYQFWYNEDVSRYCWSWVMRKTALHRRGINVLSCPFDKKLTPMSWFSGSVNSMKLPLSYSLLGSTPKNRLFGSDIDYIRS